MRRLTEFLTARSTSWIPLTMALAASAALFAVGSGNDSASAPGVGLPGSAESVQVSELQESLPSADATSALLVYSRDGQPLTELDLEAVTAAGAELATLSRDGFLPPPAVSDDETAAIVVVPLEIEDDI